jgi:putative sterol carrier protein
MSRIYKNSSQLADVYAAMFDRVADDDSIDDLVAQKMVINFRLDHPDADIWVDGRARPVVTTFEPIGINATLTARLSADSMHELLLGTLPLGKALLFRKLKVSGSKSQAMKLESLLHACQSTYPDIAADRLGS